jgi:cytochrome P450
VPLGPPAPPLIGHLAAFLSDKLGFLEACAARYGEIVRLQIGETTFLLNDPGDIQHVLSTNHRNYSKSSRLTSRRGRRLSGEGLLTSSGPAHTRQRRIMQPVFHRTAIAPFADVILECVEQRLAAWKPGEEVDIAADMAQLAQQIMGGILFDLDLLGEARQLGEAIATRRRYLQYIFASLCPFPEYLPTRINHDYRAAIKLIDAAIREMIQVRRREPARHPDMLSMLIHAQSKDGVRMDDRQILDEARMLSITGYETVGEALAWTCYLLSQHPDVEQRLVAEVQEVSGGRPPCPDDLPRLRYAERVLEESMRLYPPTWIYVRTALGTDLLPSGVPISAGAKLYLAPYVMHRNPRYFPEPERFDPERFSDAAKETRPKFAYFPFGGGPRVCIGQGLAMMEGVLVLARIAQRFRLTLIPGQNIIPEPGMTLRPKHGLRMRLDARHDLGSRRMHQ